MPFIFSPTSTLYHHSSLAKDENRFIFLTFQFISSEEGSKTIVQGYYWTPKPARDTGDNKPETLLIEKKKGGVLPVQQKQQF